MTWLEAIKRVLAEAGQAMHYQEITQKISVYREITGATPAATVISVITTEITTYEQNAAFVKTGTGEYILNPNSTRAAFGRSSSADDNPETTASSSVPNEDIGGGLIKAVGMYWNRAAVLWKNTTNLYGTQIRGDANAQSARVNFAEQIGVYALYDDREVIYVGQAVNQSLAKRLYQHTTDRLSGRWNRFSWFGFRDVAPNTNLLAAPTHFNPTVSELADTLEGILIELLEPRQNRKRGNSFDGIEFIQDEDLEITRKRKAEILDELRSRI